MHALHSVITDACLNTHDDIALDGQNVDKAKQVLANFDVRIPFLSDGAEPTLLAKDGQTALCRAAHAQSWRARTSELPYVLSRL